MKSSILSLFLLFLPTVYGLEVNIECSDKSTIVGDLDAQYTIDTHFVDRLGKNYKILGLDPLNRRIYFTLVDTRMLTIYRDERTIDEMMEKAKEVLSKYAKNNSVKVFRAVQGESKLLYLKAENKDRREWNIGYPAQVDGLGDSISTCTYEKVVFGYFYNKDFIVKFTLLSNGDIQEVVDLAIGLFRRFKKK